MRFIYITDQHFRLKTPINRIDDIFESLIKKMEYVLEYANKKNIYHIILGGDLFHTPSPSDYLANRVKDCLLCNPKIKYYYIIGNHDLIGGNIESANHCKIGMFDRYPNFIHINKLIKFDDCYLCGYDFNKKIECAEIIDPIKDYEIPLDKKTICVVHNMIVDDLQLNIDGKLKTINWQNVTAHADVILTGHYHPGFPIRENNLGTKFVNPGAFIRQEASKIDMTRPPQMAIIDIKNNEVNVKFKTIKHRKDVFNLEKLAGEISAENDRNKFIDALNDLADEDIRGDNIIKILDNIKKKIKIKSIKKLCTTKVINMCKKKIEELKDVG